MAIRLEQFGGTPWADGNILGAADLEDTIISGGFAFAPVAAEQASKTLAASGSYENGGSTAAENFNVAVGANGTVDTFNPNVSDNHVVIEASSLTESSFTTNGNQIRQYSTGKWVVWNTDTTEVGRTKLYKTLFYGTDSSRQGNSNGGLKTVSGCTAIKTNITRDVGKRGFFIRGHAYEQPTPGTGEINITGTFANTSDNLDFSSWSYCEGDNDSGDQGEWFIGNSRKNVGNNAISDETALDLTVDETDNPTTCLLTCEMDDNNLNDYSVTRVFMIAKGDISFAITLDDQPNDSEINDFNVDYSIPDFIASDYNPADAVGTNSVFSTDKYQLYSVVTANIEASDVIPSSTGGGTFTSTINIEGNGIFTTVRYGRESAGNNTITIKKNGTTIASKVQSAIDGNNVLTFEMGDYIDIFVPGDVATISFSATTNRNTGQTYTGTLFSYTNQLAPTGESTSTVPYEFTETEFSLSSVVTCGTNTLAINSETNAFCLDWKGTFPTDTSGSFDLISGATTINLPVNSVTGKTNVVSKGALGDVSNVTVKAKLGTTNVANTPTIERWGLVTL
jgi:hypothetical protein